MLALAILGLAASLAAATDAMVPLYAYPNGPDFTTAVEVMRKRPDIHFYVIVNPSNGPSATSDPNGSNGNCGGPAPSGSGCSGNVVHGCNLDWTTAIGTLNALPNVDTIGYVYARYGNEGPRPEGRPRADVEVDIDEYAAWDTACSWGGAEVDISMKGIWFDETGVLPENLEEFTELAQHARSQFEDEITVVFNPGSQLSKDKPKDNSSVTYEAAMFELADAIILKETCYTTDGSTTNGDCSGNYTPYDVNKLSPGNGLPFDSRYNNKTVNLIHQFHGPSATGDDEAALEAQIKGIVELDLHSTYFTSGDWSKTLLGPATFDNFTEILSRVQQGEE